MELCTGFGKCADICPTKATEMSGRILTLAEAVEIVEKERVFFDESGGGVTISGGEPLQQPDFLISLLDEFGRRGIHRAVDTTGFCRTENLLEVAKRTDLFLYDVKMMDADRHKKWTGVDNSKILQNLKLLAATGVVVNIRIPLVKGVNDDNDNIRQTATYVASLPGESRQVNLLPYHNIAANKYRRLGETYNSGGMEEPTEEDIGRVVTIFDEAGIKQVIVGG
jgi:pyruvate formate lyase activating enzyme